MSGLVVDCTDLLLPSSRPAGSDAATDLRVEHVGQRPVPYDLAEGACLQAIASQRGLLYTTVARPGGGVLLRLHGLVDFEISQDRRSVLAWTDPDCGREMLAILVAGNLLAMVLALRGETVLHASAVEIDGNAIAFVADSGMGKSTLAALACARGARFVTDDVLRPNYDDGDVRCWPGSIENRLRRDVAGLSGDATDVNTRTSVDGRVVWRPPSTRNACRLRAIVLPEPVRGTGQMELELLAPGEALMELTRRPRILGWIDEKMQLQTFANLSRLVRSVPVHHARLPWGPPLDPAVIDPLLRLTAPGTRLPVA